MLSFDTNLSNALKLKNTTSFWVLKLYYNDDSTASNFIGVSDINRLDGSDMYYGLVASWGNYTQSLDFFNFTTTTGNMTVKLINTDNSIKGGRFSDLLASNNFANRKWELFLNTNQAGTFDTAARMIGTGVISGDIQYDINSVSFVLLDKSSVYHKQIPSATVDASTYPSAPEKNINKPVPISYGDFSRNTDDPYYKQFDIKGAFPAIIVNRCDNDGNINALPDNDQAGKLLNTLAAHNVYMANSGELLNAVSSNVTRVQNPATFAHNVLKVKGVNYYYRHLLTNSFTSSTRFDGTANIVDNDTTSFQTYNSTDLSSGSGTQVDSLTCTIPTVPKLGELYDNDDIFVILKTSNEQSDDGVGVSVTLNGGTETDPAILSSATSGVRITNFTNKFSSDELSSASLDSTSFSIKNSVATAQGDNSLVYRLLDMWMMIEFRPSQIFTKKIEEEYEKTIVNYVEDQFPSQDDSVHEKVIATRTKTLRTPAEIEYLYFSGKGREYGAFIDADSRDNGYNSTNFIKNPIYQIEDILRTELGLSSSNIDHALFDISGNKGGNGLLGDIFNDSVTDVLFAFSQYKFINSKDLIERLCKQCFSWVFISGDGKINIRTLRRSGDYSASDKTIDYKDINLKSISKTKLNSVRNDITVNYAQDYVQDQFKKTVNVTDSTSAGTTVNGNNQSLKLETDADVIDTTTATAIANTYLHIFKDRKNIITLSTLTPKYNDLEIADIIDFSNWDSNIKIFGTSMTGYWMITSISKKIDGASIKLIQVDTN